MSGITFVVFAFILHVLFRIIDRFLEEVRGDDDDDL